MKKPAIFLDRDGVLCKEKGYICKKDELEIFPYAKKCIKKIHEKGYYAIVVTNQSGVARGLFLESDLQKMNKYMINVLEVDDIFYCPHLMTGNIKKYAIKCTCRKPQIGMITRACEKYKINLERSFMVGDRASDIICGKNAGIKTVLLESGYGTDRLEKKIKADYTYISLEEFVKTF